jgi:hypothetical protein
MLAFFVAVIYGIDLQALKQPNQRCFGCWSWFGLQHYADNAGVSWRHVGLFCATIIYLTVFVVFKTTQSTMYRRWEQPWPPTRRWRRSSDFIFYWLFGVSIIYIFDL